MLPHSRLSVLSSLTVSGKRAARKQWHQEALAVCNGTDLVFLDPDNGLRSGTPTAKKDAMKFAYSSEVANYYDRGQDVVYYCHKGRRTDAQWEKAKNIMQEQCPNAVLMGLTYHRGTQRSYIFVIHPEREKLYRDLLQTFLKTAWNDCFTDEFMNILISDKDALIEDFEAIKNTVFDTSALLQERAGLQGEMNEVAEQIEKCIAENARVAQNQDDYRKRYDALAKRFDRTKARLEEVEQVIAEKQARREMVEQFLSELSGQDAVTEYTDELWYSMIDFVTVYSKDDVRFTFKNGTEIKM